jgi:hypothetical protein
MPRRKKKRNKNALKGRDCPGKEGPFNPALHQLKALKKPTDQVSDAIDKNTGSKTPDNKSPVSEEERLFLEAMNGVSPISKGNRRIARDP